MKERIRLSLLACGVFVFHCAYAQSIFSTQANKPANATGLCKDGTYSTEASKNGACHGHHGVKEWYDTAPASSSSPDTSSPAAPPDTATPKQPPPPPTAAAAPSPTTQVRTQSQAAAQSAGESGVPPATQSIKKGPATNTLDTPVTPGGGPGLVWLNKASNIYHCPGTRFYGKTKSGSYITEAEAQAKGAHVAHGEVCNK